MIKKINTLSHHASASISSMMLVRTKSAAKIRVFTFAAVAVTALSTQHAFATGLDGYISTVSENTNSVVDIVTYFSYIGGAALSALGIIDLKKHVENPGNNPLKNGLAKLGFGGMLLAFPSIAGVITDTVGSDATVLEYQELGSRPTI
jgi:hypothetical protein